MVITPAPVCPPWHPQFSFLKDNMAAARSCMALLSLSASGAPATACHRLPAPAEAIAAKRFSSPSRCCLMPMRGSSRRLLQKYKEPGLNSLAASGLAPFWAGLAPFWAGPLLGWPPSIPPPPSRVLHPQACSGRLWRTMWRAQPGDPCCTAMCGRRARAWGCTGPSWACR